MKRVLFLLAMSVLAVSCSNASLEDNESVQAKIDSEVNAKLDVIRAQMKSNNDSLINTMARQKADSILKGVKK